MQVDLAGFLKHLSSLIIDLRLFRIEFQNKEMVASVGSAFLDYNRSRFLSILFKYFDIKDFLGLSEQQRTHFFLKLNLPEKPVVFLVNISFEGNSSRMYRSIPPPLPFLPNL